MTDTPEHILILQNKIWLAKPETERWRLGFEMIEDGRKIIEMSIKNQNPNISERDLKIAVFLRLYKNDFSEDEIKEIISRM